MTKGNLLVWCVRWLSVLTIVGCGISAAVYYIDINDHDPTAASFADAVTTWRVMNVVLAVSLGYMFGFMLLKECLRRMGFDLNTAINLRAPSERLWLWALKTVLLCLTALGTLFLAAATILLLLSPPPHMLPQGLITKGRYVVFAIMALCMLRLSAGILMRVFRRRRHR